MKRNHTKRTNRINRWTALGAAALLGGGMALSGCQNDAQTGAAYGTAIGAGLGAVIGHQSGHAGEGALIGGAVGAGSGYVVGNEKDKKRNNRYDPNYDY